MRGTGLHAVVGAVAAVGCRYGYDAVGDAGPGVDASFPTCGAAPDGDTLALYPFDPDEGTTVLTDVAGTHDGSLVGVAGLWTDGPPGCGRALRFPPAVGDETHGFIPDAPAWDLDVGSIDLWVRFPAGLFAGIVSRDASGESLPGHLTLWVEADGSFNLRVQRPQSLFFCSAAQTADLWHHVGINLGPPMIEMRVDGIFAGACTDVSVGGIAGNDNPWLLGAAANGAVEGTGAPAIDFFYGGAIDHLRISSVRRTF